MKSILVPTGGGDTDEPVFATAFAAARPFSAHLRFVHIRINPGQAALHTPHIEFARGLSLVGALEKLQMQADTRSAAAALHVREFCARSEIEIVDVPRASHAVTASWHEEDDDALRRLTIHARHSDLVVMGRTKRPNGLPSDLLELLLMRCGRPILIACSTPPRNLTGTIMVCWRETADAARATLAAMPFLIKATRVIFAAVNAGEDDLKDAVNDAASQFRWNGIATETQIVSANGRVTAEVLASLARDCGADMLVMGAYGHSRARELLFGGCTQAMLRDADLPVLLLH
jgi:nucleotide-binding universal stress UspA family protein